MFYRWITRDAIKAFMGKKNPFNVQDRLIDFKVTEHRSSLIVSDSAL